jgi:transposase
VGLQPGRRNSGPSEPQLHISKEGDPYLRTLLIPAFYYGPASLDEMAREFAYRVLAHLGLPQSDAFRWKG